MFPFALLMVDGGYGICFEVLGGLNPERVLIRPAESLRMTLLGVYPTEGLANKVAEHLAAQFEGRDWDNAEDVIFYMRHNTPQLRMTRGEVRRIRATIATALHISNDDAERRKLMPF